MSMTSSESWMSQDMRRICNQQRHKFFLWLAFCALFHQQMISKQSSSVVSSRSSSSSSSNSGGCMSSSSSLNGTTLDDEIIQHRSHDRCPADSMNDTTQQMNHSDGPVQQENDAQSSSSCCYYYLSEPMARKSLQEFQYRGQDLSLIYKYVLSPLAEWCVQNLTPRSLAPNSITLLGLMFMIASYCAMWYYQPMLLLLDDTTTTSMEHAASSGMDNNDSSTTSSTIPRWVFLFNAIAILVYQTLDNMDGKQARRVGASSPLGLYFDHGCDAVNSVFGSANWMVALALSSSSRDDIMLCFTMLMGPYALFYFGTWEEYYTGQLIMPIINGPNEGLLGAVCMSLLSYTYGPSFWHTYTGWDTIVSCVVNLLPNNIIFLSIITTRIGPLRNADLLILASGICILQEIGLKTIYVVRRYGIRSMLNLIPFVTLVLCSVIVGWSSSTSSTTTHHHQNLWIQMPRTSLHLCAILFVEMTTDLMLVHMTQQSYQPYRWILLPLVVLTLLIATNAWPDHMLSPAEFLLLYTSAAGAYLLTKTAILIHEMTYILNIWCFDIQTPRRQRRRDHHPSAVGAISNGIHSSTGTSASDPKLKHI